MSPGRPPRVCLNMIVRDEARIIEHCLHSALPAIDTWLICDTGSSDDTCERIIELFGRNGVHGRLERIPFVDFATTRNRALSLCREFEEAFDYILLIDADMSLRVEDPDFRERLEAPAYMLRQSNVISYYNTRLLRRDVDAEYVGATHEFIRLTRPAEKFEGLSFLDHACGASRVEKFVRDERLLLAELERDPANARAMYYLAQTYRDMGELEKAAHWYARRIEAGGWAEESWYALLSLARCQAGLGDEGGFVESMTRACENRPGRAEPLVELASHFRLQGDHERAARLALEASRIAYPSGDLLFIDDFANRHGGRYELSISGFYSGDGEIRSAARNSCLDLSLDRSAPSWCRETSRRNWVHYVRRLDEMLSGAVSTRRIDVECADPYTTTNPSLSRDGDTIRAVVRAVNYRIDATGRYVYPDGDPTTRTRNLFVRMDREGNVRSSIPMFEPTPAQRFPSWIDGHEDCRLFRWRDDWWCVATVRDRSPDARCEVALVRLQEDGAMTDEVVLRSYGAQFHQKNWLPFVVDDRLLFLYSSDPTIALEYLGDGRLAEASVAPSALAIEHLRGGASPVRLPDGWLHLTHSVVEDGSRRIYLHSFVRMSEDLVVRSVSEPFVFEHQGIEFAAGLAVDVGLDRAWIGYGVHDSRAMLASFELSRLLSADIWKEGRWDDAL